MGSDKEVMEAPEETMERTSQESTTFQMSSLANEEILNASFTSRTGEIFVFSMSIVDKEIPIYEVLETSRWEDPESANISFEELQQQMNNPILIEYNESVDCLSDSIIKETEEKK